MIKISGVAFDGQDKSVFLEAPEHYAKATKGTKC